MLFSRIQDLAHDLDKYALLGRTSALHVWAPDDDFVGAALIGLSVDRVPSFLQATYGTHVREGHRDAARLAIANIFFSGGSDYYQLLGARPATSDDRLRKNYQRLMALVHPDAGALDFPADAASRVNRAYATLSDPELRSQYELSRADQRTPLATAVNQPLNASRSDSHSLPWFKRWREALPSVGFRKGIVAAMLFSLVGVALTFWALIPSDAPVKLVEARPKLALAPTLDTTVVNSREPKEVPATQAIATAPLPAPQNNEASVVQQRPPLRLTMQLGSTSTERNARANPSGTAVNLPKIGNETPTAPAAEEKHASAQSGRSATTLSNSDQTSNKAVSELERTQAPARSLDLSNDVEQLLAQFASGFESGSTSALAATLSPTMQGRESLLSEYERVFKQTKQRTIRLSGMKVTPLSDNRLVSAGLATVITTDLRDQQSRQRVFLEIEVARESGSSRIVRLANYEQR
jgi:DnaJ-domain-containing protein 1